MFIDIPGIIIGAYFGGIIGVAIAILMIQIFEFGLSYFILIKKVLGPCFGDYLMSMSSAFWMSAIMAAGVVCAGMLIQNYSMLIRIICLIVLGILLYSGLIIHFEKPFLKDIYSSLLPSSTKKEI